MWISMLPTTRPLDSMSWRAWAVSPENARRHRESRVVGRVTIRFTPVAGTSKAILLAIGKATGGDGGAPGADCRRENRPGTPGGTVNRAQLGIHSRDLLPAARDSRCLLAFPGDFRDDNLPLEHRRQAHHQFLNCQRQYPARRLSAAIGHRSN